MSDAGVIGHGPLLLDFDGPVCGIFAGYPAPRVARELIAALRAAGVDVPDATAEQTDPIEVLRLLKPAQSIAHFAAPGAAGLFWTAVSPSAACATSPGGCRSRSSAWCSPSAADAGTSAMR